MKHHILLDTNGIILKKKNKSFFITSKKDQKIVSPHRVKTITLGSECLISTSAISLAVEHNVPIFCSGKTGRVYAILRGKKYMGAESLRTKQVLYKYTYAAIKWTISNLITKSEQQLVMLSSMIKDDNDRKGLIEETRIYSKALYSISDKYDGYFDVQSLLKLESTFGKYYWKVYRSLLPSGWRMGARNLRPARDPINSTLNYFYGFLYSLVEHAIFISGLSPYQDIYHQQQYNDPVLSFDLIEPFRPIIDVWVLTLLREAKITTEWYRIDTNGCYLNRQGKKQLLPIFFEHIESKITWREQRTTIKNHIYRYVNDLKEEIEKIDLNDTIHKLRHK